MTTASSKDTSRSAGVGSVFPERSKYANFQKSDQQKDLPQPPLELPPDSDLPVLDLAIPRRITMACFDQQFILRSGLFFSGLLSRAR